LRFQGFNNNAIIQRSNFEFFVLCHDEVLSIADLRLRIADFRAGSKTAASQSAI